MWFHVKHPPEPLLTDDDPVLQAKPPAITFWGAISGRAMILPEGKVGTCKGTTSLQWSPILTRHGRAATPGATENAAEGAR